ncbi:hypothetical protein V3O24_04640 [Methylobacter sp. Wu8]|uniref:hypothetical protein n=1 Tax=Methylobacter sp. Wu8 TaxID=3118457 RepID=UPI002F2D8CFC
MPGTPSSAPVLISSWGYKNLLPEEKAKICNGAGVAGKWISSIIPNTLYGLDCSEAFNIHDYDYNVGASRADKDRADRNLLNNLLTLINHQGGWLMLPRQWRAMKYYNAVQLLGDEAFYKGK